MELLGDFTVQDYLEHVRHRDDYYHRACMERANALLFKRVSVLVLLVGVSAGAAWFFLLGVGKAEELGHQISSQATTGNLQRLLGLPPEKRAELLNALSAENRDALLKDLSETNKRLLQQGLKAR